MIMNIKTVLFDLDGTLIDSNALITASFKHALAQYELEFTDEEILQFNGPPLQQTFHKINPGLEDEMVEVYREYNFKKHEAYIKLFPHVIETIEQLLASDINIGIVTSKLRDAVKLGMGLTGIDRYFETIVTSSDVENTKPHPEPVLKAMHALGGELDSTIIVGDNYHDIVSGQRAGIKTAGVAWSQKGAAYLAGYQPTYMLDDMKDLLAIVGV